MKTNMGQKKGRLWGPGLLLCTFFLFCTGNALNCPVAFAQKKAASSGVAFHGYMATITIKACNAKTGETRTETIQVPYTMKPRTKEQKAEDWEAYKLWCKRLNKNPEDTRNYPKWNKQHALNFLNKDLAIEGQIEQMEERNIQAIIDGVEAAASTISGVAALVGVTAAPYASPAVAVGEGATEIAIHEGAIALAKLVAEKVMESRDKLARDGFSIVSEKRDVKIIP